MNSAEQHSTPTDTSSNQQEPKISTPEDSSGKKPLSPSSKITQPAITPSAPSQNHPIDPLHGIAPRSYLDSTVVPSLLEGLKLLASQRPEDPLEFLGQFLLDKSAANRSSRT